MGHLDDDDDYIHYSRKDAWKIMALKVLNNLFEFLFLLALALLAYNCNWCGGPRMW